MSYIDADNEPIPKLYWLALVIFCLIYPAVFLKIFLPVVTVSDFFDIFDQFLEQAFTPIFIAIYIIAYVPGLILVYKFPRSGLIKAVLFFYYVFLFIPLNTISSVTFSISRGSGL